jgi:hypothetical protein
MSGTQQGCQTEPVVGNGGRWPGWRVHGSELSWAIAFVVPYATLFCAFAAYPIAYGMWMGREPALCELVSDPRLPEDGRQYRALRRPGRE